jgi:hypothetical protein
MPYTPKDPFEVAQMIIDLNKSIREQYYRELILVAQPAVKVYEWFYKN